MKVLVLNVRGFHLGYLGFYGNEWIETPTLDGLASEGIVFDQHYADCPEPAAVRGIWRTGRICAPIPGEGVHAASEDLLETLKKAGIATSLVVDGSRSGPGGWTQGWGDVVIVPPRVDELPLEQTLSAAVDALEKLHEKDNWLVWVEIATLVPPWDVPPEYSGPYFEGDPATLDAAEETDEEAEDEVEEEIDEGEELEEAEDVASAEADDADGEETAPPPLTPIFDPQPGFIDPNDSTTFERLQLSYASAVTLFDAGLEALIEEIGNLGLGNEVVFLMTSDHGYPLGEHGVVGLHRPWLHDELIHVPLMLSLPEGKGAGLRISALTQHRDLMPTLLDLFGLPIPPVHGRSLLPLVRNEVQEAHPYAVVECHREGRSERALRTLHWSYLCSPHSLPDDPPRPQQLYAKPEDRWEVNNLVQHHLDLVDGFDATLREFLEAARKPGAMVVPGLKGGE